MDPLWCVNPPNRKFGEIYCNYMGALTVHCLLCPKQMEHDEFIVHYMIHFKDFFEIKQEIQEDLNMLEPNVGIDESAAYPLAEEIKLEVLQENSFVCSEMRAELSFSDDSYQSTDQLLSEVSPPCLKKRGRPKNPVRFTEPKKCGICGKSGFIHQNSFKDHIRIHQCGPSPKFFECDICGRRATKLKNLIDHFRYKHTQKIRCETCKKMIRRNYMVAHMKRHNNERNYKCTLCDRSFVMAGELTTHLKFNHSASPVKVPSSKKFIEPQTCSICAQKFIGKTAFERHLQSHGTTPSLYECDICGRKVKEKKNLMSHMTFRHSGMPKVKAPCTICGKVFNRKYLNLHVRKHNVMNQKPSHICPTCGKTFLVSGDLSAHIRQHNRSVETAPCSTCGKTFASPASLADHNRVHSGERPFPCNICGSRFRTRSMLYVHRTIHLTEKNYACDICDMRFKNPAYVKTHKRKVHEKNRASKKIRDMN